MDFFGIGFGEVLLVLVITLIIWGPGRLAEVGRTMGKTVHAFRKAAADLTSELGKEIEEEEKKQKASSQVSDTAKTPPQDTQKTI